MEYKFPIITDLEQVKEAIKGYDEFKVIDKGDYIVVNYAVAFENTFDIVDNDDINGLIRRECRGLIFNKSGELISRPYHKFFNFNEREETRSENVNFRMHVILEKLDGSMIRPIPTDHGFRLGTKAGITDVAMNAEQFIADKPQYANFIDKCIKRNLTPIFEWCSRKNRIVIDYPEDQLILTGLRNTKTGLYCKYSYLRPLAQNFKIPVVNKVSISNQGLWNLYDQVKEFKDNEGIVLRFDDGHMLKIKAEDYVLRHRSKDAINQEKNIIEIILNDSVDDLIPLLTPEDSDRVRKFEKAFWTSVDDVAYEMAELFNGGNTMYPEKKDFAVNFVQKMVLPIHAPIMYGMKAGKGAKDVIVDMIRKSLSTQTKIDQNRWLLGGLNWNHTDIHINN